MMKNILFIILLVFGLYKIWKYLTIRHFESTKYLKQIKEIKCEALPPAKHNNNYSPTNTPDPWDY